MFVAKINLFAFDCLIGLQLNLTVKVVSRGFPSKFEFLNMRFLENKFVSSKAVEEMVKFKHFLSLKNNDFFTLFIKYMFQGYRCQSTFLKILEQSF